MDLTIDQREEENAKNLHMLGVEGPDEHILPNDQMVDSSLMYNNSQN